MRFEQIIISPIKTEKSQILKEKFNQYVFKVHKDANKPQIKKAIEELFKVKVKKVRVVKIPPKRRTFRGKEGFKPGYKKAIVTLEKGEKIEIK